MESSSSSSLKWDIFFSCRGDRTSNSFISQLQAALMEKKNKYIIDYELTRGYKISSSLLKAIEESRVSIIIVMEDYVFNTRCLEELVEILELKEIYGQIVIQVFYGICQSDWIENMDFEFEITCRLHVLGKNSKKLRRLSDAWNEAVAHYYRNIIDSVPYCIHVEDIVQDIFKRSTNMSSTDDEDLVGIDSKIEHIQSFSSIPNSTPQFKYDVFLSFRGEDTRYNFISHLHAALSKKNIKIFVDNQLRKGYEISPSLLTAIEESRISVVVFSKDYASSTWCLQELAKILECREMYGQIVIPVFHGIYASDVRKQTGTFSDAFAKHEQVFGYKSEKLQRWKTALTKAANISGWDSSVIRYAFKQNHPPVEYMELSNKIVSHTGRVPLALTVLGSMLREREKPEWETVLSKITRIIDRQTYDVLKLSYDELDDTEKQLFLDIACFFVGEAKETVMHANRSCIYGLDALKGKSLLTVSKNKIEMHNLIQAMGREIV